VSPIASVVLTSVLLLAMLGTGAGAWLKKRRNPSRPIWQSRALRDALLPGAGWCSLFVLDGLLTLLGVQQLPLGLKHLLGTLALLLLYYAVSALPKKRGRTRRHSCLRDQAAQQFCKGASAHHGFTQALLAVCAPHKARASIHVQRCAGLQRLVL
jgi:hypothetical protein